MKSPPKQVADDKAHHATESFIRDNARKQAQVQEGATTN
jgi:hypothetical protein